VSESAPPYPAGRPGGERRRGRGLAARIALLTTAVAVITALVTGLLGAGLIQRANVRSAERTLSRLADAAQATTDQGLRPDAAQLRARRTLEAIGVHTAIIRPNGQVRSGYAAARVAITSGDVGRLLAGKSVHGQRRVGGRLFLIEGRPTRGGAIALVQRRSTALSGYQSAVLALLVALAVGLVVAVLLGLLVASRLARPLRTAAAATRALAAGQRDIVAPVSGPLEVAEVGEGVNALAAALRYSEGRQREFLLSVSHDLRTPLTAISGYAESLAEGVVPPAEAAEVGAIMLAEAQRLNRMVSDLLDYARLGAQEFPIELVRVDLVDLARDAARVWSMRSSAAGVSFDTELQSGPLEVVTDPTRVRQVLDGLFDNALRVTPPGSPIVLAARGDGPGALLEVRDGGPGLTEADLDVAFDRSALYNRYRGIRQVGTGLGLAIVNSLVERLGGRIEAGHAAEGGARFTVRLPPTVGP
jgi:two-component system OmpR family sensor kinase